MEKTQEEQMTLCDICDIECKKTKYNICSPCYAEIFKGARKLNEREIYREIYNLAWDFAASPLPQDGAKQSRRVEDNGGCTFDG